jgi:hypothetical protein
MKCHYCGFNEKTACQCFRCTEVRVSGWCNANHRTMFYEELELEKRKTLDKAANN